MLSLQDLTKIFNQKKQKIERRRGKDAQVKGRLITGFETIPVDDFLVWYKTSNYESGCHYCGTTAAKSFELYNKAILGTSNWTRGGKREKRLELDRKDSFKKYDDLNNLVWCCYWCNNAKSNFFAEEEFKPISLAIGEAIRKIG